MTTSHAAALAAIESALEVEAGATPGPWMCERVETPAGFMTTTVYTPSDESIFEDRFAGLADARAIGLARALLRPALEGAGEVLRRHREIVNVCGTCRGNLPWPCPDATAALALADLAAHVSEGGAK